MHKRNSMPSRARMSAGTTVPDAMLLNVRPPDAPRVRTAMRSRNAEETQRNPILQQPAAPSSLPVSPTHSAAEPRPPAMPPSTSAMRSSMSRQSTTSSSGRLSPTAHVRTMLDELRQSGTTAFIDDTDDPMSPFFAIQLMANGTNSDAFFHAIQPTDDPYYLRLVSERPQTSSLYYTITARGVSLVRGNVVEFTPLEQWIREYMLHRRVLGIRFFQVFPQWRCSYRWRAAVKRSLVSHASARLTDGLLQLNAIARPRLWEIRKILLSSLVNRPQKLLASMEMAPMTLDAFSARQQLHAQRQLQAIIRCCEDIRKIVEGACKSFHRIALDDIGGGDFSEIIHERTASKRHVGLTNVCRYMTRDALVQLTTASSRCLADMLERTAGSELFSATLRIDDRGTLSFSPSRAMFEATVQGVLSSMLAVVEDRNVASAMAMDVGWEEEGLQRSIGAGEILADSVEHLGNIRRAMGLVGSICDACDRFTASLGTWTGVYLECTELTAQFVRDKDPPPAWFQSTLGRLRGYLVALDAMPPKERVANIFNTDTSQVPTVVRPLVLQSIRNITRLLPRITQEKTNVLLVKVSKTISCLQQTPQALEDVAPYLNFCRDINMDAYDEAFRPIARLFGVLESDADIGLMSMTDLLELRETLQENMSVLANVTSDIADVREKLVAHFSRAVSQELTAVHARAEVLLGETRSSRLSERPSSEEGSDEASLCEVAHGILVSAEALLRSEHRLVEYQNEFGVEMTPVESVRSTRNAAWLVHQLWAGAVRWRDAEAALLEARWVDWSAANFTEAVAAANAVLVTCSALGTPAVDALRQRVERIQYHRFVVDVLLNKHLQPHHWRRIDDVVRKQSRKGISNHQDTTLQDLIHCNIALVRSELLAVALAASQEVELERQLLAVQSPWVGGARQPAAELQTVPFKDLRDMWVVGGADVDAIRMLLDASRTALTVILQNRFCEGALRARTEKQLNTLVVIAETVDKWLAFQKLWMLLEAVFGVPEIARQWPEDEANFVHADRFYRDLMKSMGGGGCKLHQALSSGAVSASFDGPMQRLEAVSCALEQQLDNKRASFPRLYFMSNAGILDLLGMSRYPERTHVHIGKMFEFVAAVRVSGGSSGEVTGVLGSQGEVLEIKPMRARGDVERWLGLLEKALSDSVRDKCFAAVAAAVSPQSTEGPRHGGIDWVRKFPLQALLVASHVAWSAALQHGGMLSSSLTDSTKKKGNASAGGAPLKAGGSSPLQRCLHRLQEDLDSLTGMVRRKDIRKIDRLSIATLITQTVDFLHATKRILMAASPLADSSSSSCSDRADGGVPVDAMLSLTATASPVDRTIQLHLLGHTVAYGYEYIGVVPRLVMTDVTRSAFASFVVALRLHMASAAVGPPGTGKSETVKEFARTVAKHNYVFNCSAATDVPMLLRVLCGLAQQGSFVALDEFHCVGVEVLSVVAMQLRQLQCAVATGAATVTLNGVASPLRLAPHAHGAGVGSSGGLFVTMNPRSRARDGVDLLDLPENLRASFRPMAMFAPNTAEIVEVVLASEGFRFGGVLAPKVVLLFELCAESMQSGSSILEHHHAEGLLGLRAIKPMLLHAASLLPTMHRPDDAAATNGVATPPCSGSEDGGGVGVDDEMVLMVHAIVSALAPRLTSGDMELLRRFLEEIFGATPTRQAESCVQPSHDDAAFDKACRACAPDLAIDIVAEQLVRMHHLYHTLCSRLGVAVVGRAGAGKSVVLSVTRHALGQAIRGGNGCMWQHTVEHRMNPASMTFQQLFGAVHPTTNAWTEGCLPWVARQMHERHLASEGGAVAPCAHWVVFDGPADARWMESLNSSLDDSRVFCFDNGQRWAVSPTTRIVFECETLAHAAPSTVSRLGVVALDDRSVEGALSKPIDALLQHAIAKGSNEGAVAAPGATMPTRTAQDVLSILASFLKFARTLQRAPLLSLPLTDLHLAEAFLRVLQGTMLYSDDNARSVLHSVGFALVWSVGCAFDGTERESFDVFFRSRFDETGASVPPSGLVFDYCLVGGDWVPWPAVHTLSLSDNSGVRLGVVAVLTDDMQRVAYLRHTMGGNFLITGPLGSGKSTVLKSFSLRTAKTKEDGGHTTSPPPATAYITVTRSSCPERVVSSLDAAVLDQGAARLQCGSSSSEGVNGAETFSSKPTTVLLLVDDVHFAPVEDIQDGDVGDNGDASTATCPTIELLRQILSKGKIWDAQRRTLRSAGSAALHMTCTAPQSSGGNGPASRIGNRMLRHMHVYALSEIATTAAQLFQSNITALFADVPSAPLKAMGAKLVAATLDVFTGCAKDLSSRPGNGRRQGPHVRAFGLSQLSTLFRGLRDGFSVEVVQNVTTLASLWVSECHRTFRDRLTTTEDTAMLDGIVAEVGTRNSMYVPPPPPPAGKDAGVSATVVAGSLWCTLLHRDKLYEPLSNYEAVKQSIGSCAPPGALVTPYLVQHVCRTARILTQHAAHGLLLGPVGHGKRFTVSAACARLGHRLAIADHPSAASLKEAVHTACRDAVARQRHVAVLVPNAHLLGHEVLEVVQQLLTDEDWSVCVPSRGALDALVAETEATLDAEQRHERQAVLSALWKIVQSRVTLLITMSSGDVQVAAEAMAAFPALSHRCVIDYYEALPPSTLDAFAARGLGRLAVAGGGDRHVATALQLHDFMAGNASQRPKAPVPPTVAFMDYVHLVLRLHNREDKRLTTRLTRLEQGCERMRVVQKQVVQLGHDVRYLEGKLSERADVASQLMEEVNDQATRAAVHKSTVRSRQSIAQEEASLAQMSYRAAQEELLTAAPAYEAALDGIRKLNKADIDELRTYSVPPRGAATTMEAVLTVLGEPKSASEDWNTARTALSNGRALVERLLSFDVETLTEATVSSLRALVGDPDFTPQRVGASGSRACRSLCAWVHAVYALYQVHQVVAPKRARFLVAEEDAAASKALLNESKQQLLEAQASMASLHSSMDAMEQDKAAVERQLTMCRLQLKNAEILSECLRGESDSWSNALAQANEARSALASFVHVAAATMAYAGALPADARDALTAGWRDLPLLQPLYSLAAGGNSNNGSSSGDISASSPNDLRRLLPDGMMINWHMSGLPWDVNSLTNATTAWLGMHESKRWPLLLDPEGHGLRWLRKLDEFRCAAVISCRDEGLLQMLKSNVASGTPTIVTDVDPQHMFHHSPVGSQLTVHDLLHRNVEHGDNGSMVRIGDEAIAYGDGFYLAMVCRALSHREVSSEVLCSSRVVNFCPTKSGIEEQVLTEVLGTCMHHVEAARIQSLKTSSQLEAQVEVARVRVLETLNRASLGSLLDDEVLVQQLQEAHLAATSLSSTLAAAREQDGQLQEKREHLRPVARAIASAYAAVTSLKGIRDHYRMELDEVKRIALDCMAHQVTIEEIADNVPLCVQRVLSAIFIRVRLMCCSEDQPIADALFFIEVLAELGEMSSTEVTLWKSSDIRVDAMFIPREGPSLAMTQPSLTAAQDQALASLELAWGTPLKASIVPMLTTILTCPSARSEDGMPKLDAVGLRHALLLRLLRPDLAVQAIGMLAEAVLGPTIAMPSCAEVEASREKLLTTMAPSSPLFLLVMPGSDPTRWVEAVAAQHDVSVTSLCIGRGRDDAILHTLKAQTERGGWLLLHNGHVSPGMVESVAQALSDVVSAGSCVHHTFRVVVTYPLDAPHPTTSNAHSLHRMVLEPSPRIMAPKPTPRGDAQTRSVGEPCCTQSGVRVTMARRLRILSDAMHERRHHCSDWACHVAAFRIADAMVVEAMGGSKTSGRLGDVPSVEPPASLSPLEMATIQQCVAVVHEGPMVSVADKKVLRSLLRAVFELSDDAALVVESGGSIVVPRTLQMDAQRQVSTSSSMAVLRALASASVAAPSTAKPNQTLHTDGEALARTLGELALPNEMRLDESAHPTLAALRAQQDPLAVCLWNEVGRTNALLGTVSGGIRDALQWATGACAATRQGRMTVDALADGIVPPAWLRLCPAVTSGGSTGRWNGALDMKAFVQWISDSAAFLSGWMRSATHPKYYPLRLLHAPRGLLHAQLRRAGGLLGVPLDNLRVRLSANDAAAASIGGGCTSAPPRIALSGLVAHGFMWDVERRVMACPAAQSHTFVSTIPAVYVDAAVPDDEANHVEDTSAFACPVYHTASGEHSIGQVDLPSGGDCTVEDWVVMGACLRAS